MYTFCEKCKFKEFTFVKPQLVKDCDLLIIGQNPGAEEQKEGYPFCLKGKCGNFLRTRYLPQFDKKGIKYSITNALKCGTPNNKTPTKKELDICKPSLIEDIKYCNPKLILTLGKPALMALTGITSAITPLVGKILYDYSPPICVCLHPSTVISYGKDLKEFEKGILPALKYFDTQEELEYRTQENIEPLSFTVGLDIETTGLLPIKHKIKSVSISEGKKAIFSEIEDD